jgi:hypothetical protein
MVQNPRLDWKNFVKNVEPPTNIIGVEKYERLGEIDSEELERKLARIYNRPEEQYAMISFDNSDEYPFLTADVYRPEAEAEMITDINKTNSDTVPGLPEEYLADIEEINSILRREYDNIQVEKGGVLSPQKIENKWNGEISGQLIRWYLGEGVSEELTTNSNVKWVKEDEDERIEWIYDRYDILDVKVLDKDSGRTDRPVYKMEMASRTPFRNTSEYQNMKNRSLEVAGMDFDYERTQEVIFETMGMLADSGRFRVDNIDLSVDSGQGNKI